MRTLEPSVVLHGQLEAPRLADLMRRCRICVLPSFYEGVPLVLVEALACGCRLVATDLPGIRGEIAPHVGDALDLVPLPRMVAVDVPATEALPRFAKDLAATIRRSLARPPLADRAGAHARALGRFTWDAVFRRVESIWLDLAGE
jgi:glycosyltransferase involved in cell wall biosynthesis